VQANIKGEEHMSEYEGQGDLGEFTPPDASDERQMAIDEAMAHEAYLDEHHPLHKSQVAKVQAMFLEKYPENESAMEGPGAPQPPQETVSPISGIEMPPMPEGQEWDETALQSFIPIAKELGFSDDELQTELEAFVAGASRFDPVSYSEEEGIEALNERWGQSAAGIVKLAQEYINGLPDQTRGKLVNWLETTQLGNHPRIVEALARRGKKVATA
jgi:hypothetical protein